MNVEIIDQELRSAKSSLAILEEQHDNIQAVGRSTNSDAEDDRRGGDSLPTLLEQLLLLETKTDCIAIAQDYSMFLKSAKNIFRFGNHNDQTENEGYDFETLLSQLQLCDEMASQVILKHANKVLDLFPKLYEDAYLPLFDYLHEYLVTLLREELKSSRYPTAAGCAKLTGGGESTSYLSTICKHLARLESRHKEILEKVEGVSVASEKNSVFLEFFHPLLDRVYFHFVKTSVGDDSNEAQLAATRPDQLPELLLNYIKNVFLQNDGPYRVIRLIMGPSSVLPFCQELVRLIQWVLVEQRHFFDDPAISGPHSNPQFLYQAMERFLEFDTILMELLADTKNTNDMFMESDTNMTQPRSNESLNTTQFNGLMDELVTSNDEVFNWWVKREREFVSSTLFNDDNAMGKDVSKAKLANHVSPRAELFCSLIRSVQLKASTLTDPGIYLREVAVPLCSQFVDALHETSVDLRNSMIQKQNLHSSSLNSRAIQTEIDRLDSNINKWFEIINGTHLASQVLLSNERALRSQSDHDLGRFGRSLQRLVEVMMDEFAAAFVETIVMEHAKFANYMMLASHFLASPEHVSMMDKNDLTAELNDTKIVLQYFEDACDSILHTETLLDGDESSKEGTLASFAPSGMRARVAERLVEKLLDVAIDTNDVTPDIWIEGATIFSRDVNILLRSYRDIPTVYRMFELTKFMTMEYDSFRGLFAAIGGLIGSDAFIDIEELNADTTISDEASSMLKAKNIHCPLSHAVSVLNRRRS